MKYRITAAAIITVGIKIHIHIGNFLCGLVPVSNSQMNFPAIVGVSTEYEANRSVKNIVFLTGFPLFFSFLLISYLYKIIFYLM